MRPYLLAGKRVWVAGHAGMVGQALVRRLRATGCRIIAAPRAELDLRRQADVERFARAQRPEAVIVAAGTVGGILPNRDRPADFLGDNLAIATNVLHAAHAVSVEKLLYLGSSCIYPRAAPQPLREESLGAGLFEPTNAAYALAKSAGIALAQALRAQHGCDFITALPTNLYGPGDSYDLQSAHAPAALIRRLHAAKVAGAAEVVVWGTGRPLREVLHVDDCARACVRLMERWSDPSPVNVGGGCELTIAALAQAIARVVGFRGGLVFDPAMPDGAPRKRLDGSRMAALGWRAEIGLEAGLADAYADFLQRFERTAPTREQRRAA